MMNIENDLFRENSNLKEWWLYLSDIRDRSLDEDENWYYNWRLLEAKELELIRKNNTEAINSLVKIFNIPVIHTKNTLLFFNEETAEKVLAYNISKNLEDNMDNNELNLEEYDEYFNESIDSLFEVFNTNVWLEDSLREFRNNMNQLLHSDLSLSDTDNSLENHINTIREYINNFIKTLSYDDLLLYTLDEDCTLLASLWYAREYLYAKYYPSQKENTILSSGEKTQIDYADYLIETWKVIGKC